MVVVRFMSLIIGAQGTRGGARGQSAKPRTNPCLDLAGRWRAPSLGRSASARRIPFATKIRKWAIEEVTAGRLFPWFAVASGFGIVLYFTAEREPASWAAIVLTIGCAAVAVVLRRHHVAFVIAVGLFAMTAGFAVATVKTALMAHPVLRFPASGVTISGFVELREESQHTDRFVLRVERMEGGRMDEKPDRVRLSVKRGTAPPAGAFVEVKALLDPPLQPLEPGSYDFARDIFFQGIGASGFVRGRIDILAPPASQGPLQRADALVQGLRDAIDARIRAVLPGDPGAIAAMLINGRRDCDRSASLRRHVCFGHRPRAVDFRLSYGGRRRRYFFHFPCRSGADPGFGDRFPIKKWAAFAALLVTAFYLVLSGNQVATQRSFIMIAVVLIGVMLDRPTLTMRTITIAALLVLFFAPQAVVHPSFQMSFAATLALVAGYERGAVKLRPNARLLARRPRRLVGRQRNRRTDACFAARRLRDDALRGLPLPSPLALRGACQPSRHAGGVGVGHAHGILGVVAMPFGLDAECWRQMGYGIEWMDAVALWVASLPGAYGRVTAFGTGPLLLATAGLLVIGLLRTPLRWTGALLMVLAVIVAARRPLPDVLVADDGRTFAVRGVDGRLSVHHTGGDTSRPANGSRPMPTAVMCMTARLATISAAIHQAVSAGSRTAAWLPTRWRRMRSRTIAGTRPSSWRCAIRRPTVPRWWLGAATCGCAAHWRFAAPTQAL